MCAFPLLSPPAFLSVLPLCRIVLGREELLESQREQPSQLEGVAAVQCKGNFMFDPATHRDFLGKIGPPFEVLRLCTCHAGHC